MTSMRHLLVVDDDPAMRDMLVSLFQSSGYRATQAASADSALALCASASALGAAGRRTAVDEYSLELPGVGAIPSLGGLFAADLERAVELRPDLVLGARSEQQQAFFAALRARGVRCEELETGGSLVGVLAEFQRVGALQIRVPRSCGNVARLPGALACEFDIVHNGGANSCHVPASAMGLCRIAMRATNLPSWEAASNVCSSP